MRIAIRLSAIPLLLFSIGSYADLYKCTGKDGRISYQQVPCANSATESKVEINGSRSTPSKWILVESVGDDRRKADTYLDVNSVARDGSDRRARIKVESHDRNAKTPLVVGESDYLVDCNEQRLKLLRTKLTTQDGWTQEGKDVWSPFPLLNPSSPSAFHRTCEIKLAN